jgi:alkylhydroperoxidase/carboxymuconolactone decarboxylase family protein YurZ
MDTDQRTQRGIELLKKMLGAEQAAAMRQRWQEICPQFEEYVLEFVAGEIWSRPGLDLRTRSLITIATLAGMGRTLGLELNIRMALKNGASQRDIVETLLHIAPYAGFPACWEGLAMAHKIFAES